MDPTVNFFHAPFDQIKWYVFNWEDSIPFLSFCRHVGGRFVASDWDEETAWQVSVSGEAIPVRLCPGEDAGVKPRTGCTIVLEVKDQGPERRATKSKRKAYIFKFVNLQMTRVMLYCARSVNTLQNYEYVTQRRMIVALLWSKCFDLFAFLTVLSVVASVLVVALNSLLFENRFRRTHDGRHSYRTVTSQTIVKVLLYLDK